MELESEYLKKLTKRAKESRAYTKHQLLGLEISQILEDEKHKSLYIKLAKEGDPHELLAMAKEVADRKSISNKGAYFMKLLQLKKDANRSRK